MTGDPQPVHEPRTRLAAYALCVVEGERILLCRMAPDYPAAGRWTLPGGGVAFGEDPADAAVRELSEETGLEGRIVGLALVHSGSGPGDAASNIRPWHGVRIVYDVAITGGELRDERDGSTDRAAWFALGEARELPVVDLVEAALARIAVK